MKKYMEESGNLILAAMLTASGAGLVFRALACDGGVWAIVKAFERAACGGIIG